MWLRVPATTSIERMSRSLKTALSRAVFCVLEAGKAIEIMEAMSPTSSIVGFLLGPSWGLDTVDDLDREANTEMGILKADN